MFWNTIEPLLGSHSDSLHVFKRPEKEERQGALVEFIPIIVHVDTSSDRVICSFYFEELVECDHRRESS